MNMPRGPRGEKRPADVIGTAIKVARIATGEEAERAALPAGLGYGGGTGDGSIYVEADLEKVDDR
jgi:hypothetical protein